MSDPKPITPEEIFKTFYDGVVSSIDKSGMGLTQVIFANNENKLVMEVHDSGLNQPGNPFWHIINKVDSAETDYLLMAMDMNSFPDQGLEFSDFVLVCEFDRRRDEPFLTSQWRYGVINYDKASEPPLVRPIDWENKFWNGQGAAYMKRFGPPFRAIVKRARA